MAVVCSAAPWLTGDYSANGIFLGLAIFFAAAAVIAVYTSYKRQGRFLARLGELYEDCQKGIPISGSTYLTGDYLVSIEHSLLLPLTEIERIWFTNTTFRILFIPLSRGHSFDFIHNGKYCSVGMKKQDYANYHLPVLQLFKNKHPSVQIGPRR